MSRWGNKHVVGLTGNIAVGKSVVRQMLQHLGAVTIDADGLAHQAMSPGAPAYKPVVETFGQIILNPDKTINRAMLGSMVFSNPMLLEKLEAITHPVVGSAIDTLVNRAKQKVVVIEAIKLLEGTLAASVNEIWVVDASPKSQYIRLINKRKMSPDDAKRRIQSQNPQAEKRAKADVVINNDGNVEETWKQVQAAWANIKAKLQPPATDSEPTLSVRPANAPTAPATQPPAAQPPAAPPPPEPIDVGAIDVKRGMPNHAEIIAEFIRKETGNEVNRMDVIMSFGQKSYLIAQSKAGVVGVIGWQVENLITRADELYVDDVPQKSSVIYALSRAVEDASRELQSEVSFVFLPPNNQDRAAVFVEAGYQMTTIDQIKIPAWREAVQELMHEGTLVLQKRLRDDRVLKPI